MPIIKLKSPTVITRITIAVESRIFLIISYYCIFIHDVFTALPEFRPRTYLCSLFYFFFSWVVSKYFFKGIRLACLRPDHDWIFWAWLYNKAVFYCYVSVAQSLTELPNPRRELAIEQRSRGCTKSLMGIQY